MIYNIDTIVKNGQYWPKAGLPDGRIVLARPESGHFRFQKLKAAWMVFTGKADVLKWTGQ